MNHAGREDAVIGAVPRGLFIAGEWRDASEGRAFAVEDPSTGRPLVEVQDATATDALEALDAASSAQERWAATPPRERGEILYRVYQTLMAQSNELALVMTLEMGKPLAESQAEVTYAAEFFRWFSEEAVRVCGTYSVDPAGDGRHLIMRQPVGPCLLITPWNFPLAMAARKIAPAVAAGCTMVVKPARLTPLSTLALAQIMADCGLPNGVANVITTSDAAGTTQPLIVDGRLRKLSFTGSTEVGKALIAACASQVLRVSMELGGNAPFVVFDDADLEAAVDGAVLAKMRNTGQACTAANRFYIHESIADEFGECLAKRLEHLKIGRGTDPGVEVGPLIDQAAQAKVGGLVANAIGLGATAITGGKVSDRPGSFYTPTVLTGVPDDARLLREEIFGPVATIVPFATDDEAIAAANDTEYGLVAYAYTANLDRALRIAEALEFGMVGLNRGMVSSVSAPFGGVKHSGIGREGGRVGIDEYLSVKYVAVGLSVS